MFQVDDDREDPLVIDEAEEKSDGGDSDEKVNKRHQGLTNDTRTDSLKSVDVC